MRIDPEIAALRSDRALQRRVQVAMEAAREEWLGDAETGAIVAEMEQYSTGACLDRMPHLSALVRSTEVAGRFVTGWCDKLVRAMCQLPLGQVPFRYNCSTGYSAVRLLSVGCVSLSLLAYEERDDLIEPSSACFVDCDMYEVVLAGHASGQVHRLEDGLSRPITRQTHWAPGDLIATRGAKETRQIRSVSGRFSLLQLARENASAAPTREISLENGNVLHTASGDKRASQTEMALAVLGAMQRSDAAPAIELLARSGSAHLRWQAVRHVVALNPGRGFALLSRIANSPRDELCVAARNLRTQLSAAYPQLLEQELEPCPV